MRVLGREFVLVRQSGVLDFSEAGGIGTAGCAERPEALVADVEVGIDCDRDDRFFVELEGYFEVVAIVAEKAGVAHFRFVDVLVIGVVLNDREGLRQRGAGDEEHADPIVNQSMDDVDGMALLQCADLLHEDLSFAKLRVGLVTTRGRQLVNEEKRAIVEFRIDSGFGGGKIMLESGCGVRLQLRRPGWLGSEEEKHHEEKGEPCCL